MVREQTKVQVDQQLVLDLRTVKQVVMVDGQGMMEKILLLLKMVDLLTLVLEAVEEEVELQVLPDLNHLMSLEL